MATYNFLAHCIFYYKPKSKAIANALTFESIARQLWGANYQKTLDAFPAIKLRPNTYQYSDFRSLQKKAKDWILKVYGHTFVTRFTGKTVSRAAHIFWKEYIEEELRIILMARWNNPDLLEIRVQRNESRRRVEEWHDKVWAMLKPALVRGQFNPWELSKGMGNLITQQSRHTKVYSFRDASVVDTTGVHASFQTYEDQGNLAGIETRDSLQI
jgi:hypothetical protein